MLKTTKFPITHMINEPQALNFSKNMVGKGFQKQVETLDKGRATALTSFKKNLLCDSNIPIKHCENETFLLNTEKLLNFI